MIRHLRTFCWNKLHIIIMSKSSWSAVCPWAKVLLHDIKESTCVFCFQETDAARKSMLRKTWLLVDEVGFVRFVLLGIKFSICITLTDLYLALKFVFNYVANLTMRGD